MIESPKVEFDPGTHTYSMGGRIIPSVTQIIKAAGLYPSNTWGSPEDMLRGTNAHTAIQYHIEGNLDEDALDPLLKPYLDGYKKFVAESNFLAQHSETLVFSDTYSFAGTIDIIGELNGESFVIDIKTGGPDPAYRIQTAAYKLASGSNMAVSGVTGRACLYLAKDGTYKLEEHKAREDVTVFLS